MQPSYGYGTTGAEQPLGPLRLERRDPGPHDVQIEILCIAASAIRTCTPRATNGATQYVQTQNMDTLGILGKSMT